MKKMFIFTFFIIILNPLIYSQIDSTTLWHKAIFDTTADFYTVCDIQDQYFRNHPDSVMDESGIRSEFYRWYRFWNHRVSNDNQNGSIKNAIEKYQQTYQTLEEIYQQEENPSSDWFYIGPKRIDAQRYGIVICAKFDKSDPTLKTYFAGTGASGLWKTTDGGLTWKNITGQNLLEGLGVMDIAIHPTNHDIIYIAIGFGGMGRPYYYGKGILKTINGGKTWENVLSFIPSDKKPITRLLMDPTNPNRILALGANYIYKTTDGETFTLVPSIPSEYCFSGPVNWIAPKIVRDVIFQPGSSNAKTG